MDNIKNVLSKEELTAFTLRALYAEYGYEKYRMSKFEEYDLYVRNKDFLVSESVITFTDTDGKLLALKPDVTLSILKNAKLQGGAMKVYYNENVYRVSKGTRTYKEIMQVGLECLGDVTEKDLTETVFLAAKSLDVISSQNVLELSNLSLVEAVLDACSVSDSGKADVWTALGEKNLAGVQAVALSEGLTGEKQALLEKLVTTYGKAEKVLPMLDGFCVDDATDKAVKEFKALLTALLEYGVPEKVQVDFSLLGNMKYYNGVAFKGFVEGIPTGVLSGGQYDKLMSAMGKKGKAVGFAVYLDRLERFGTDEKKYDTDVLLVYDESSDAVTVTAAVRSLIESGKTVMTARAADKSVRYRELAKIVNGGIEILEAND